MIDSVSALSSLKWQRYIAARWNNQHFPDPKFTDVLGKHSCAWHTHTLTHAHTLIFASIELCWVILIPSRLKTAFMFSWLLSCCCYSFTRTLSRVAFLCPLSVPSHPINSFAFSSAPISKWSRVTTPFIVQWKNWNGSGQLVVYLRVRTHQLPSTKIFNEQNW